jgi:hypothetical protein
VVSTMHSPNLHQKLLGVYLMCRLSRKKEKKS